MRRILLIALILAIVPLAGNTASAQTSFTFHGGGFGHGVGMSQYGALGMARGGHGYQAILKHYYTGVNVGTTSLPPSIRIGLRQGDGGFRLSATGHFDFSQTLEGAPIAAGNPGELWDVQREGYSMFLVGPDNLKRGPYSQIWQRRAPGSRLQLLEFTASGWRVSGEYQHGTIESRPNSAGSSTHIVLDFINMEHYVYGVAEVPSSWPAAAKEAQAVAARSYAARRAASNQNRVHCSCAVVDDTRDQVYAGFAKETPAWTSAVDATSGVVVTYGSEIANTLYSSSSGGWTEDNDKVFGPGGAVPYLRGVDDPADNQPDNARWRWNISMTQSEVSSKINNYLTGRGLAGVGTVNSIEYPAPRGRGGRIIVVTGDGGGATIRGSQGTARLHGEQLRSALGLPSTLLFPQSNLPTTDVSGGHVVDFHGALHPFGGAAPPSGGQYYSSPIARDAHARADGRGGYFLAGNGDLISINGAPSLGATPSFPFDIARSFVLTPDGGGAYILDGYGAVHSVGTAPPLSGNPYWAGWDIARAVTVTKDGMGAYVLDGYGGIHRMGSAPAVTMPYFGFDIARDITINHKGDGAYVLDGWQGIHAVGGAPSLAAPGYHSGLDSAARLRLRSHGAGGYVLDRNGTLIAAGGAPSLSSSGFFPNGAARAFILPPDPRGYLLSGDGTVARFGLASNLTGPSFPLDIARDLALRPDTTGYVLDGYGGLHPIGTAAPPATGAPYFEGDDRMKRVVLVGSGGYTLDKNGTLYPFNGASPVSETASFWPSDFDVARDVAFRPAGGGYILAESGHVKEFGGAPAVSGGFFEPGQNRARAMAMRADGASGYVLDVNGGLFAFGGAPTLGSGIFVGDARDLILRPDGRSGWILTTAGLYSFGGAPPVSGGLLSYGTSRAGIGA